MYPANLSTGFQMATAHLAPSGLRGNLFSKQEKLTTDSPKHGGAALAAFARERSSSNRNLPEISTLRVQPRRASDEAAGSSSQKLSARVSPATSRRSISVMNVHGDQAGLFSRPNSRLGSQSSILRAQSRKNSNSQLCHQQAGPTNSSSCLDSTKTAVQKVGETQQQAATEYTPSGRRSSIVGIQSMAGYRSQKNSHSDATDHDSTRNTVQRFSQPGTPKQSRLAQSVFSAYHHQQPSETGASTKSAQHRASFATSSGTAESASPICSASGSRAESRRGSTDQHGLQRRGSLVSITLRKLRRTISMSKGDQEPCSISDGRASRRGSSSSYESISNIHEDLGVSRRVAARSGKQPRCITNKLT